MTTAIRLAVIGLGFFVSSLVGDTNSWTGSGGDNLWSNPSNWSLNTVPTTSDVVHINVAGTYTVEVDTNVTVASLFFGATGSSNPYDTNIYPPEVIGVQTLVIATEHTVTCPEAVVTPSAVVSLQDGTLAASRLRVNGELRWMSGTLYGGDMFTSGAEISSVGRLLFSGAGSKTINTQWVTNYGTAIWEANDLSIFPGAFHNVGTFVLNTNCNLSGNTDFYNSGTIRLPSDRGEVLLQSSCNFWTAGTIEVQANSMLLLHGTSYRFWPGAEFAGEGVIQFNGWAQGGGAMTLTGNLELNGGAIAGSYTWTGPGQFTWRNGSLNDGSQTFDTETRVNVTTGGGKNFSSTITNRGTFTWQAEGDQLTGGVFYNEGTFAVESNCSFSLEAFYNLGTIVRPADLDDAFLFNTPVFYWEGNFHNSGVIRAEANSTLILSGEGYLLDDGTEIAGEGLVRLVGSAAGSGNVAVTGTFELQYGTISGDHTWNGDGRFDWHSGSLDAGTTLFGGNLQLYFVGAQQKSITETHVVTNLAIAKWQADGGILVNSGVFCNLGNFVIDANCSTWGTGEFYNTGTISCPSWLGEAFFFCDQVFHNRGVVLAEEFSTLILSGQGYLFEEVSEFAGAGLVRFTGIAGGNGDIELSGTLELDYGTISGDHTWSGAGQLDWRSGGFDNVGTSTFAVGTRLNFVGSSEKTLGLYSITNNGTVTWQADGGFLGGNSGSFCNAGTFIVEANCSLQGAGEFINSGTIVCPADTGDAFLFNSRTFYNHGTIAAETNATLSLSGEGYQLEDGSEFGGAGLVRFTGMAGGNGDVELSGTLELDYGTISGDHTWSGAGQLDWRSGGFDNFGTSIFAVGTRLNFVGSSEKTLGLYSITNNGTVTWRADGGFLGGNSGSFCNAGTFVVEANCSLQGTGEFINSGTIVCPADTGDAFLFNLRTFHNRGTIAAGTNAMLSLSGEGYQFHDGTEFGGAGLVVFNGIAGGVGDVLLTGVLELHYGTIGGDHTWNGPGRFDWRSGGFDNGGTSTFGAGTQLRFVGSEQKFLGNYTITNAGTATWDADGGTLYGSGAFYNAALLVIATNCSITGSGPFQNDGTIQSGAFTLISGPFINNGTVETTRGSISVTDYQPSAAAVYSFAISGLVQTDDYGSWFVDSFVADGLLSVALANDYVPTNGSSFKLFQAFSPTGAFAGTNLPALPSNMSWRVQFEPEGVLLTVVQSPTILQQPGDITVMQGTNVTWTVAAVGTGALNYQWNFNGTAMADATSSTLTLANVQAADAGAYSVTISNEIGVITSDAAVLTVITDPYRPVLTITSPKANLVTNVAEVTLLGTAKDNAGIVDVQVQLNGGTEQSATLTGPSTNVNWSLPLSLAAGTNVVLVKAFDAAGNWTNATRSFFRLVTSTLTVNVTGNGFTIPTTNAFGVPTNTAELQIGRTYRITAVAGSNYVFTNWTGSIASPTNVLDFIMQSNMVLTANFIPNPFIPVSGNYNGLFYETNGVEHHSAGFFALKVNSKLAYSGKLLLEGDVVSFSGKFALPGTASRLISRAKLGKPDLTLSLALDFSSNPDHPHSAVRAYQH